MLMNKKMKLFTMVVTLIFLVNIFVVGGYQLPVYAESGNYYVSPVGNDNWSGTLPEPNGDNTDGPFKTIQKVRDVVRTKIANGMTADVTIILRGGSYYLDSTLTFDERDSGRDGYKVIYKNYPGEEPIINGGQAVTGWQLYQGNIYKAYVGTNWKFDTLFENGKYSVIARYPNTGYNKVSDMITSSSKNKFEFNTGDIPIISNMTGLQVYMWPGGPAGIYNWFSNTINVQSIDYTQRIVTLNGSSSYEMGKGSRYYLQGALELLDQPGEFYLDKVNGMLYYYPRQLPIEQQDIVAPKLSEILDFKGSSTTNIVKDIQFEGVTLRNTDYADEYGAVTIENASGITIKDCIIHNTGMYGVLLKNWTQNNVIYGNKIYDIGHTGVQVNGPGGSQYTSKFNQITNNHIYNTGLKVGHGSGIQICNSGDNLVSHNRIHDTTRYAISMKSARPKTIIGSTIDGILVTRENVRDFTFTRNNHIEYNDLSNANTDSQDTGVIEAWGIGTWNYINNNHIHDSNIQFSFGYGIYLDDGNDYTVVSNNIIDNLQKSGDGQLWYAINGKGLGCEIYNNIVANNNATAPYGTGEYDEPSRELKLQRNIFYNSGSNIYGFDNWADNRLKETDYNLFYNSEGKYGVTGAPGVIDYDGWRTLLNGKYDQYSVKADPNFIDPSAGDYRLRYDSPAYSQGFKDIDVESIGLLPDYKFADTSDPLDKIFVKAGDNSATVKLNAGEQAGLTVTGRTVAGYVDNLAGADIQFSSENPSTVTVDNQGVITAVGSGVSKITVSVTKSGITKNTDIYAVVGDTFNSVKVTTTKSELIIQQTLQLKYVLASLFGQNIDLTGTSVAYTSDNESVLSVNDQGLVTAVGAGTANIIVLVTKDGITKTATKQIRVLDAVLASLNLSVDKKLLNVNETTQIISTGTMSNGLPADFSKGTVTYSSSDSSIIQVDSKGLLKAINEGKATITVNGTIDGITKTTFIDIYAYLNTGNDVQEPWKVTNYGDANGFVTLSNGVFTTYGNGSNVWGNADDFIYVYQDVSLPSSPNKLEVTATLNSLVNSQANAAVGVMIRDNETEGSKNVMFRILPGGGLRYTYRTSENGPTNYAMGPTITFPAEIKVTRVGNDFSAYYKKNDQWVHVASVKVEMDNDVKVGIGTFSIATMPTKSVVSNVSIKDEPYVLKTVDFDLTNVATGIKIGDTQKLNIKGILEDGSVSELTNAAAVYTSSNEAVAVIDSQGVITAKAPGIANITASVNLNGVIKSKSIIVTACDGVSFYEGFENGVSGWTAEAGVPKTSSTIKRSGNSSFVLDQDREIITKSLGKSYKGVLESWFYEDGVSSIQAAMSFGVGMVGPYSSQSVSNYVVRYGSPTTYTITSIQRKAGWHQVIADCYTTPGMIDVYIDGVFAVQLTSPSGIGSLQICDAWQSSSISNMYFDDLTIYDMGARLDNIDLTNNITGMKIGETQKLNATGVLEDGSPANLTTAAAVYKSSNEAVAVVDPQGNVTAKGPGIANITVSLTLNGVTKSKSIMVTVNNGVSFYEGFENGLSGWKAEAGTPKTNSTIKRSGNNSFVLDQDKEIITKSLGIVQKGIFECWFYEDGKSNIQAAMNFGAGMIGPYSSQSTTNYVVRAGSSYTVTNVQKQKGWHQVIADYYSVNGKVNVYIDGVFAVQLDSSGMGWLQICDAWQNGSIANMYFDDLTIYDMGDTIKPQTTANINGDLKNGCYSSDAVINLTATDDFSGVAKTEYSLDGGTVWNAYTGVIAIANEGINTIKYRSTDKAGNVEDIRQETVIIDKTAPVTTVTVNGTARSDGTYNSHVLIALASEDGAGGSGIAGIQYSLDGVNWLTYTTPLELNDNSTYSISYKSTDNAGNIEVMKNISIIISMNPDVMVSYLKEKVNAISVEDDIKNSLVSKLENVLSSIMRGNKKSSCNQLNAFINEVEAQSGKKLTVEQADDLKTEVHKIITGINTYFGIS